MKTLLSINEMLLTEDNGTFVYSDPNESIEFSCKKEALEYSIKALESEPTSTWEDIGLLEEYQTALAEAKELLTMLIYNPPPVGLYRQKGEWI